MPDTLRERIVDDVVALLAAGSPPATPQRSRTFSIEGENANSIIVYWTEDRLSNMGKFRYGAPTVRRELDIRIEIRTKGTDTLRPDEAADALASWVEKKLDGQSKGIQNGSLYEVLEVEKVGPVELEQKDHAYALIPIYVVAKYRSRVGDPETWA